MIELRWKLAGGTSTAPRVLQYRTWHVRLDAAGAITPTPLPIEWTPWADVPFAVVDEESGEGR